MDDLGGKPTIFGKHPHIFDVTRKNGDQISFAKKCANNKKM